MAARIRRLNADYERVAAVFTGHPYIRVIGVEGTPPEKSGCSRTWKACRWRKWT